MDHDSIDRMAWVVQYDSHAHLAGKNFLYLVCAYIGVVRLVPFGQRLGDIRPQQVNSKLFSIKVCCTGWRRPIGCLVSVCHFPQKSPVISSSFAENDLQLIRHSMGLRRRVSDKG